MVVHLSWPGGVLGGTFRLPASKSVSNRALVLRAVAGGGPVIENLSEAHDTQLLARLLALPADTPQYDCEDAGTTLRFLTAYLAVQNRQTILTGTARMQLRPIGDLVDALRTLGASIGYLGAEGFPPLRLGGFRYAGRATVAVRAAVSSQFASALLLVAPALPAGLTLVLEGPVSSAPYLALTLHTLRAWGATIEATATGVRVGPGLAPPAAYVVEADWSAASYAYALVALAPAGSTLRLPNLSLASPQGDRQMAVWAADLGVRTQPAGADLLLTATPTPPRPPATIAPYDFAPYPDLAQTVLVLLAARGEAATLRGLHSLRVKETDRVAALQAELPRIGATLLPVPAAPDTYALVPQPPTGTRAPVETYHDHRMALAFAPLALRAPLALHAPGVVRKSFPVFWEVLAEVGFRVEMREG